MGKKPIKGGRPAREKRRIIMEKVIAGEDLRREILNDQCFVESFQKMIIIALVIRI